MAVNDCLGLEITELRLGLPGGGSSNSSTANNTTCKSLEFTIKNEKKRVFSEIIDDQGGEEEEDGGSSCTTKESKTNQKVVGWPPVCSYRRNKVNYGKQHDNHDHDGDEDSKKKIITYVKVSMDGAPFLRKVDLSAYQEYTDLLLVLEKLFGCTYAIREALKDADSSDYVPIYEDKDGDWMLVGDVPWNMFTESCKRLRIMKKTEAKGIGFHAKGVCFKANSREMND